MHVPEEACAGISAVLSASDPLDQLVLDLAAVLAGLVSGSFEIIVVGEPSAHVAGTLADLRASAPGLPLRLVEGRSIACGCEAARYNMILVRRSDGHFDVRELNHLLEVLERGADVAMSYRPHHSDPIVRQLQRWGWQIDLDYSFGLFGRQICQEVGGYSTSAGLLWRVRQLPRRIVELPTRYRRPTMGTPMAARSRAA